RTTFDTMIIGDRSGPPFDDTPNLLGWLHTGECAPPDRGKQSRRSREGEPERAALGVAADRPPGPRVDHLAAELDDALQRRLDVGDLEVRQRDTVSGARAALVHTELRAPGARLPPVPFLALTRFQLDFEEPLPEAARALRVVGRELDERDHETELTS